MSTQPYVATSEPGLTIYGGQDPPEDEGLPSWVSSTLYEVVEIPGSDGAGGAAAGAWGGMAVDKATGKIYYDSAGGHHDSSDNRVVMFDPHATTPAWVQLSAPSAIGDIVEDQPYYLDGRPTSRHIYSYLHHSPQNNRLMHSFCRFAWGNAQDFNKMDGFDLATNTHDPAGTHPDTTGHAYGPCIDHVHGKVLYNSMQLYDVVAKTWGAAGSGSIPFRYPVSYGIDDNNFFTLMWGGGETDTSSAPLNASIIPSSTLVQAAVTFNASAAYTQFLSEKLVPGSPLVCVGYCGMDYDSINNRHGWYSGHAGREGHFYEIELTGAVADMTAPALTGVAIPTTPSSGINARVKYLPTLKGFVLSPTGTGKLYYFRTSP